jgi:CRISPR/Cas system endoribonuclease Cas6 (RAMP superfamily)
MIYVIKKTITKNGKKSHVLLTNGHSEILEIAQENVVNKLVEVMNENSDSNCEYEVLPIVTRDER